MLFCKAPKTSGRPCWELVYGRHSISQGITNSLQTTLMKQIADELFECVEHFVELVLKGLSLRRRAEHCKVFEYAVFSPPCFHVLRLNTETYKIYFKSKFPCSVQRRVNKDQQKKPRYSNIFEVVQLAQNNCQIFRTFLNINIVENRTEASLEPNRTSTAEHFCENRYRVYRFTGCHS